MPDELKPATQQELLNLSVPADGDSIGEVTDRGSERQSHAPPPLRPDVFQPLEKVVKEMWPGLPVIPTMSTGASDGRYLRLAGIPTYGIACMFFELDDNRAHGRDERVGVKQFFEGVEVSYALIRNLSSGG